MNARRIHNLLATSSVTALLIGVADPAVAGSCTAVTGGFANSAALTCITVTDTSFTGNVSNSGTISAGSGAGTKTAVLITGSTITGAIIDSGIILAPEVVASPSTAPARSFRLPLMRS